MRYELIEGETKIINLLIKDGWKIENTFPNPYPQPYFFALMKLEHPDEDNYNVQNVIYFAHGNVKYLNQWGDNISLD